MPIEIDEAELAAKNRVLGFVNSALNNPKTRGKVLEIQKELDPNFTAPELETRQYVDERLGAIEKLLKEDIEARSKRDAERAEAEQKAALEARWNAGRETARRVGYTDEGMAKLEEYMQRHGILDHAIAMPAFERENPLPKPVETGDNRWGFFDVATTESPDLKPLFEGNDEQFLRTQIAATLNEFRSQR
jgi:hypothetical protein